MFHGKIHYFYGHFHWGHLHPVSSFPHKIPGHLLHPELSGGHLTIVPLDEISLGQSVHGHLQPASRYRWEVSTGAALGATLGGKASVDEKMKKLCGAWSGYI